MLYDVYLQIDDAEGRVYAHAPALLGCDWSGATPEEALARAPQAIAGFLAWLRRHGQPAPPPDEALQVRLAGPAAAMDRDGTLAYTWESDRQPVSAAERARFLALMACARADLLALTRDLPQELLDREPAPGAWSIRQILRHVANAELWLLRRILDPAQLPEPAPSSSVWQRLEVVRALAVERLGALSEAGLAAAVVTEGELWTARKVFRRFIEHELEHCAHVREVLGRQA